MLLSPIGQPTPGGDVGLRIKRVGGAATTDSLAHIGVGQAARVRPIEPAMVITIRTGTNTVHAA